MICGIAEFDPTVKSVPPTIQVASVRVITDQNELRELGELLAEAMIDEAKADIVWCDPDYKPSAFDMLDRPESEDELAVPRYRVGDRVRFLYRNATAKVVRVVQGTFPRCYVVKLDDPHGPFLYSEESNHTMEPV